MSEYSWIYWARISKFIYEIRWLLILAILFFLSYGVVSFSVDVYRMFFREPVSVLDVLN